MHAACPECGSKEIGRDNSERFCQKCGFVVDDGTFAMN